MDPVLGRGASKVILVDAMRRKPFVDEVDALVVRRDKRLDFLLGEVFAVTLVEGVAAFNRQKQVTRRVLGRSCAHLTS